jgi:hypothetical protein
MASLTATLSTLVPSLSSPCLADAINDGSSDTSTFAWSLYPPPSPDEALPSPRHHSLCASNYLASPLAVLWVAGLAPPSYSSSAPYLGAPRQSFIFVDDTVQADEGERCVEWLQREADAGRLKGRGKSELVWVVKRSALESVGEYSLGREVIGVVS